MFVCIYVAQLHLKPCMYGNAQTYSRPLKNHKCTYLGLNAPNNQVLFTAQPITAGTDAIVINMTSLDYRLNLDDWAKRW